MNSINGISYYLDKCQTLIKHVTDGFSSFRNTVHWCTCIVRATQSNCCGALDFLSPEPCPPIAPTRTHWLQDLGSHTAAWVWVANQKDWRNQGATSWILAMDCYSIWVKKCDFCVSSFCQVMQKHKLFEVAGGTVKVFWLLTLLVTFLPKNIKMRSRMSKL